MTQLKRFARKAMSKRLFLSSLLLLSVGVGTSQAQNCPKPVFRPFDATINAYATFGTNSTLLEFLPSILDSTSVTFGYSLTGATTGSGSAGTGTGGRFNIGLTYVTITATNTCGTTSLNFTVNVSPRFHEMGHYQGHTYYRTPYPATWHQADSMARSIGGNLITVSSEGEDYFLSRAVPDTMRAWIGLTKESGVWRWANGEPYEITDPQYFHNWCPGMPDNWKAGQNYGLIHSKGVPVGTDACWDDGHDANVPGTNDINNYFGVVETVSPGCTNNILVTAAAGAATNSTPDKIFLGYGPQSDTLNAMATGIGDLTYSWSGDGVSLLNCTKCKTPEFTPEKAGNYALTVTVTDRTGCTATATKTICVMDIRERNSSGALTGNIWVCHTASGQSTAVNPTSTSGHMGHFLAGTDVLGKCGQACGSTARIVAGGIEEKAATAVQVYPNPTQNEFFVEVPQAEGVATVTLLDIQGKVLETRSIGANDNRKVRFDLLSSPAGMYIVDVNYDGQRYHAKIVRQ